MGGISCPRLVAFGARFCVRGVYNLGDYGEEGEIDFE